jgi:replicative DNA helicase Mcm
MEVIRDFYLKMRGASEFAESPIAITARQLESIVRLAEARARVALREEVTADDAKRAVLLMSKSLEQVGMDVSTGKIDIDIIMTGKPKSLRDKLQAVIGVIVTLSKQIGMAEEEAVYKVLEEEYGISRGEAANLIQQLRKDGTIYAPKDGFLKKT